ncbi:hypothetical protein BLNAU_14287 [Blattamonas nauphoetae]|uniref:Uncharacterized protein n=1 Tax=Blattamonas nauphoetae TaxID=2049346 RepID=A0ABQ9XE67_9EUKA|nr:hypothetical protein BLNAU_14287 [Blattamonas nauphoetae]
MPLDVVILFLLHDVAAEAVSLVSTCWLGNISNPMAMGGMGFWWKIGVDGFLVLGLLVLLMLRSAMTAGAVGRSARVDHNKLMDHVMSCASSFFDTTPMGRIHVDCSFSCSVALYGNDLGRRSDDDPKPWTGRGMEGQVL